MADLSVVAARIEHVFAPLDLAASTPPLVAGSVVDGWSGALSASLVADGGLAHLDDAARLDAIRSLERLVCVATAAQAALAADLDRSQCAEQEARGVPASRRGQGVAAQVAWARRESPHRAQRHLALARLVADELPCTWSAWCEGRVTEWAVTVVARETACLGREDRLVVDRAVAGDADRFEAMGPREVGAVAAAEAARPDPASVVLRRRRAESERHVGLRPAPDTMTWFSALLPVKHGVGLFAALSRAVESARSAGDPRTRGQVMADALVARVVGGEATDAPSAARVSLDVVISDTALLGGSEDPARLEGYGAIPAELARELVVGTLSDGEQVELRRLYTSPRSGQLVAMDSRSRRYRGLLARFVRLRDGVCRTARCEAPVRHVDHVQDHAAGGPTTGGNAQGLCEACNHARQAPGWTARPGPDGAVETTLPTGVVHTSRPPPLASVRHVRTVADYVLTG